MNLIPTQNQGFGSVIFYLEDPDTFNTDQRFKINLGKSQTTLLIKIIGETSAKLCNITGNPFL